MQMLITVVVTMIILSVRDAARVDLEPQKAGSYMHGHPFVSQHWITETRLLALEYIDTIKKHHL